MINKTDITLAMIDYFKGDPRRINHFIKVHGFASIICQREGIAEDVKDIIETTALVHDIGIKVSEIKYQSSSGTYQEIEGPPEARKLLQGLGIEDKIIERACWLIANHHTYGNIKEMDHQILVEADFLVNIYEDGMSLDAIRSIRQKIFKTKAGLELLDALFL